MDSIRIEDFQNIHMLVVGDLIFDQYCYGNIERISPEFPVPVFNFVNSEYRLGGAANVANNLRATGCNVDIIGKIGNDELGKIFISKISKIGIGCKNVLFGGKTICKTRYLNQNNIQVLRVDDEEKISISKNQENEIMAYLFDNISKYDGVFLSDYLKGMLTDSLTKRIIDLCNEKDVKTFVDVKSKNLDKYKNVFLLKPNKKELEMLSGLPVQNEKQIKEAILFVQHKTNCKHILTTLGSEGMILYSNNIFSKVFTENNQVYDVTGAGDTVLSYFGACSAIGCDLIRSMELSNIAAGIKVSCSGTVPVKITDVLRKYYNISHFAETVTEIKRINKGKKIVFTNGCFDLLHTGHVHLLKEAKKLGDVLVVGVNSDASVKRLKGNGRPVNSLKERMELLSALKCVDYVVSFDEDTPIKLIEELAPDVLVKGGDYKVENIVGFEYMKSRGKDVVCISYLDGLSTTNIVNKCIDSEKYDKGIL